MHSLASMTIALAVAFQSGELNPLEMLQAMGSRTTGCVEVTQVNMLAGQASGYAVQIAGEYPIGVWLGMTSESAQIPDDFEVYVHPRRPEITLALPSLPLYEVVTDAHQANRDATVACFLSVL